MSLRIARWPLSGRWLTIDEMTRSSRTDPPPADFQGIAIEIPAGYAVRRATLADTATIARHRRSMFEEIGSAQNLELVERAFAEWLPSRLDQSYVHWLAEREGRPVGSAGVLLLDWPPSPRDPRGGLGFVYNVYVEPAHRRRGLARATLLVLQQWSRQRGLGALALHASDDGQHLYETLGYLPTNEMRIDFLAIERGEWPARPWPTPPNV
jgi:GNAT superfamily N-acetyltransferase